MLHLTARMIIPLHYEHTYIYLSAYLLIYYTIISKYANIISNSKLKVKELYSEAKTPFLIQLDLKVDHCTCIDRLRWWQECGKRKSLN